MILILIILLEREKETGISTAEMYREAHWFCNPKCRFVCNRSDKGAIQAHQERCDYCIEAREKREAEEEAYKDGLSSMRWALHLLEWSKQEIEITEKQIAEEKE